MIDAIYPYSFFINKETIEKFDWDGRVKSFENKLICGDNLVVMRSLPDESIDLIYIDPPFFSGRNYKYIFGDDNEIRTFSDVWEGGLPTYLAWLNARLWETKRVLKSTGSLFVHLDWHACHYVKCELDKIFGYENLVNEVIWCYTGNQKPKRSFTKKHDNIFWYCKDVGNYKFNQIYDEYSEGTLKRYNHIDKNGGRYKINKYGGKTTKSYMDNKGKPVYDYWKIPYVIGGCRESTGYPTQKPELLLERIIKACSNKNDIIADFFLGGGTTAAVAEKLGRRWIACDSNPDAIEITKNRIKQVYSKKAGIEPINSKPKHGFELQKYK